MTDVSAVLAIVLNEPDAARYAEAMASNRQPRMPSGAWTDAPMRIEFVADARASIQFDGFPPGFGIQIIPLTAKRAGAASLGQRRHGGPDDTAGPDFGGCLGCGVAKVEPGPPLLDRNDFARTDVKPALKD